MRTITLEEHFISPAYLDGPGRWMKEQALKTGFPSAKTFEQLSDLGAGRIAEMDAAKIDVQVLSLNAPGVEQLETAEAVAVAREANDYLGDAVRRNPSRLGGFAALASSDPGAAVAELERTVRTYGFKGAMINGHTRGRYLDDPFFWPIFEAAVSLNVPVYLHPTPPPKPVIEASYSGFSPFITQMFAGAGWGWHIETGVHVVRIILGGVFDRFPKLQLAVGHLGEALPFMLQRLDFMSPAATKLQRPISSYLRENVHYTFSGFNFTSVFMNLLLEVGVDRIMFSVDYPYGSMAHARSFLEQLPLSPADREKIAHGNAERLLKF